MLVTLLGRRDGGDVPGVGSMRRIGRFITRTDAEAARDLWLACPTFEWSAEITRINQGDEVTGFVVRRPAARRYVRSFASGERTFWWRGKLRPA